MFSFLSGIYIYVIAWGLFGQDNTDTLGPESLPDFVHLSWIATGTGLFFAAIFHIGTKEPQICQSKESATTDLMKSPGKFIEEFGPENANSRRTSLAFKFTNMVMASTEYEEHQNEMDGCGETKSHEVRVRKRSLLQKFAVAIFADGKTDLEVQHFDSERKKSLRTLDFDDILLRLQHEEHEQPKCFGAMENQITMDGIGDDHATDEESLNARQEEIKNITDKDMWKMTNSGAPKTSFVPYLSKDNLEWCFFRMIVNLVSLTLDLKMMEVMMIRRKAFVEHQLGSKINERNRTTWIKSRSHA